MGLPGLRCKSQATAHRAGGEVAAQPRGGGVGPLDLTIWERHPTRNAPYRARSQSGFIGEVAQDEAVEPASAFLVIGMSPPSTA
jgi:hypothetical protein